MSAASAEQEKLAMYAAQRSTDGALTLIVINKTTHDLASSVALAGFTPTGPAKVYRYNAANLDAIVAQPDQPVSSSGFDATFPAYSITLLVAPSGL